MLQKAKWFFSLIAYQFCDTFATFKVKIQCFHCFKIDIRCSGRMLD